MTRDERLAHIFADLLLAAFVLAFAWGVFFG